MQRLSAKEKLGQKVLVRTINEFLRRRLFTLEAGGNHWENPVIEFEMAGIPAIASVADIGHEELSIHVTLWPNAHGREFIRAAALHSSHRLGRGGFYASAWLERKKGAWLQTSNGLPSVSCTRDRQGEVERLPWEEPLGFSAEGKFFV
ncbi:hypothetical protein SAMN04488103_102440 [Gemmobacter aquatilis]|uniref:Uncharacterized protein n=1 Tax=Gemmobacter aquatilis TaxID=933059 RepID=A0A1H8CCL0_9RHOB|nr:hypothetical protein [Gemmobacter aquatilis]SEM91847.1 hypothetical protein SAMN04488103_102440 [Gemmobacter aquatilis]